MSTQVAEGAAPERGIGVPRAHRAALRLPSLPVLAVAALTVLGFTLRLLLARQSLFADELSTYWISAQHSLGGVLSLMYGTGAIKHAEITPPLYFLLAWLPSQFGHSAEWLRLPSLIAGTATIPLVYMLGLRTVGRRAALLATALTTLSPFMIYYSTEARAYAVMMLLVLGSTLAMLTAVDSGRVRWWVLYAACACAAVYCHYTCVFALAAQLAWLLWAHPRARRPAILASAGAAVGVLPWLPGLIADLRSPTLQILSALSPFTASALRVDFEHWAIGYPTSIALSLRQLPGLATMILLVGAAIVALPGFVMLLRGARGAVGPDAGPRILTRQIGRRVWLVAAIAVAAPIGELVAGALGKSILDVRNLASAWPYMALLGAAVLLSLSRKLGVIAAGLVVAAFALAAGRMLEPRFQRPDIQAAAAYVQEHARPGDVVIDETGPTPGPLTAFDVAIDKPLSVVRAEEPAERSHPFGYFDAAVSLGTAVRQATATAGPHRVFLVTNTFEAYISGIAARGDPATRLFPAGWRLVGRRSWPGIGGTLVAVYAPTGAGAQ